MKTEYNYQIGEEIKTVTIERDGDRFQVIVDDNVYNVAAKRLAQGQLHFELGDRQLQFHTAHSESGHYVAIGGETWMLEYPQAPARRRRPRAGADAGSGSLQTSTPGLVLDVLVTEGDQVERGQTLVLLEAMKMELRILAPFAGQVGKVHCTAGQVVERGQILVEIEEQKT